MNDPDEEREADRVGPKIVAGLAVAGAGVALGPDAALALGAASPLFESLAQRAWGELRPDARRRTGQMLSTAADAAGSDAEQLGEMIGASEQTRLMTGLAMQAAERTTWPPKVIALGRVLAAGLIASDDAVDIPHFALDAMVELDRLHVSLLDLLVRYEPERESATSSKYIAVPYRDPAILRETGWRPGGREWRAREILAVRPELAPVLRGLIATLVRHGLAEQVGGGGSYIYAVDERAFLPTQLGEQVLGFYLEAGAETEMT